MDTLSPQERLHLKNLIGDTDNFTDNTENIRKLKHSLPIRLDTLRIVDLKQRYPEIEQENPEGFKEMCIKEASFLYTNYTDIFNRLVKGTLDVVMLYKMLIVLKMIEDEKIDQHRGSVMVGTILKDMFIDSNAKETAILDAKYEKPNYVEGMKLSWKEYKEQQKREKEQSSGEVA